MPKLSWPAPPWLCISLLVVALVLLSFDGSVRSAESSRTEHVKKIWQQDEPFHPQDLKQLRQDAWNMFDFGFSHYMKHAFPKDNLLPITCTGENWQGGIAMTLVDALDALLIMNRRADVEMAVHLLREHLTFSKRVRVHVFETVIRELGGLLSAHMLLIRDRSLVPEYDGLFLTHATELADRLLPAFNTASGLPTLWVNLDGSPVTEENNNITCTACAGTLLLEFGVLSQLTGNRIYREKAEHAARVVYGMRSKLGLVGGSLDTNTSSWVRKDSSIGPGIDSYYEYLLKAYLMFGERMYLDMFVELYTATMQHMTLPGTLNGYSFLVDVHMDNGRLAHPWVSSLGAFWPAMQVLAGQEGDAVQLHSNFTAAWQMHGWLPEVFNLDLSQAQVHPEDPGYNLRPEHIESTYLLHSYTRDPRYLKVARDILKALQMNKVQCGFASITNVQTGEHGNIMESFFLSETMKYLYLTFTDSPPITDYYIFSTEGHLLPTFASESDHSLELEDLDDVPDNCRKLCSKRSVDEERQIQLQLQGAFPLIKFNTMDATTIRARTCVACIQTTKFVKRIPIKHPMERAAVLGISPSHVQTDSAAAGAQNANGGRKLLAQLLCTINIGADGTFRCGTVRSITQLDIQKGLPQNGLVLQLSQVLTNTVHHYLLLHGINGSSVQLPVSPADFGQKAPQAIERCLKALRFSPGNRHGRCPSDHAFANPTNTCHATPPPPLSTYTKLARYMLIRNITREGSHQTGPQDNQQQHLKEDLNGESRDIVTNADGCSEEHKPGVEVDSAEQSSGDSDGRVEQQGSSEHPGPNTASSAEAGTYSEDNKQPDSDTAAGCSSQGGVPRRPNVKRKRACEAGMDLTWGRMVLADPPYACETPLNEAELRGNIAVVLRGRCSFLDKALWLQFSGAAAMVVLNFGKPAQDLLSMAGDGTNRQNDVHIPSMMIGRNLAFRVLHWLHQFPLTATFVAHQPSSEAGAPPEYSARVDLLVPVTSQTWIQRMASVQNLDVNVMFEGVLSDAQALEVLWNRAKTKKKQTGAGMRKQASVERPQAQVETEVKQVETEVKQVETEVKQVETEVKQVETEVEQVETEVKQVQTEVKQVETEVKPVETEVKQVQTEVKPVETELRGVEKEGRQLEEEGLHSGLVDKQALEAGQKDAQLLDKGGQRLDEEGQRLDAEVEAWESQQVENGPQEVEEGVCEGGAEDLSESKCEMAGQQGRGGGDGKLPIQGGKTNRKSMKMEL